MMDFLLTLFVAIFIFRYSNPSEIQELTLPGGLPMLVVHGGAGDIPTSRIQPKLDGVKKSALAGYEVLKKTNNVFDAIEAAIHVMEDDEAFNAGRGSVLNLAGEVEMEALIIEGKHFNAGAVTLVKNIAHPISLARMVLEKTPHRFLGGAGLEEFIVKNKIPRVNDSYLITETAKRALENFKNMDSQVPTKTEIGPDEGGVGTVGCVAVDTNGHVASGTSTGGITGKYKGRIGDTPIIGSGGYSDDDIGAVSTTGHGESIMPYNLAHRILTEIASGNSAQKATQVSCENMTNRFKNTAGAITVSNKGDVGVGFTSKRMAWAYVHNGEVHYGIDHGQHLVEKI
ncbi:isoaspartyl peptidase/L-asparaginase isoform X2 [Cimex lectularius]|uniref:Asparaginase n=2 Tax=Cimex lectularius TaxID=79782 RepID=A0A8I6SQS1_CIMLE|nr:isoaspartyl peptidase/L-asparaginase isoform X2 [Cimex lectularius]